jgi:glycosyltransferase involved in cell wall biosynthesis
VAAVLLVHPDLKPPGGAAGVTAWMAEALQREHVLTLLTLEPVSFAAVNRAYGTALDGSRVRTVCAGRGLVRWLNRLPLPLALLRNHLLHRRAREMGGDYDVVVNTANEAWLGRPSVQYIHFPWGYWPRPDVELRWFHRIPGLLPAYRAFCAGLSAFEGARMRENLMLVNSDWTGDKVKERYGGETVTLYPPVEGGADGAPWEQRDDVFLCIGRISPEKRVERVMDVMRRVRQRRPEARLVLVGAESRLHGGYFRRIRRLAEANRDWLSLVVEPDRASLGTLMARSRYGLHAMVDEHFGMAVAEMARAGCVVFTHDSGGQREIVEDPRLLYDSEDDAVRKIEAVLADRALQVRLQSSLRERSERFSTGCFMASVRRIVEEWPSRPKG